MIQALLRRSRHNILVRAAYLPVLAAMLALTSGCPLVTGITVTPASASIDIAEQVQLTAHSSDAEDSQFAWSSSNEAIASVDATGLVTGVAEGQVTISALGSHSGRTGRATVTVGLAAQILAMEQDAFEQVNVQRTNEGLAALIMDEDVRAVARGHSEDMAARDFFDHVNPDGLDPFERLAAAGIAYTWAGENIAWNNYPDPVPTAVEGWMNSQGHRENILRQQFTHTGMGVASDGAGGYYFTQVFTAYTKDGAAVRTMTYCPEPLRQEKP